MYKEFRIKGFSNYILRTDDEENIDAYVVVNKETGRIKRYSKNGSYSGMRADDGKAYNKSHKFIIWDNAPYFQNKKRKIEDSFTPVFGYEDEYCIDLNTSMIWNKKHNWFLTPYKYKNSPSVALTKKRKEVSRTVGAIVWETKHKKKIDSSKEEVFHLDFNPQNNTPTNLILLPLDVAADIRSQCAQLMRNTKRKDLRIQRMFDAINKYKIPQKKKQLLEQEIIKLFDKFDDNSKITI